MAEIPGNLTDNYTPQSAGQSAPLAYQADMQTASASSCAHFKHNLPLPPRPPRPRPRPPPVLPVYPACSYPHPRPSIDSPILVGSLLLNSILVPRNNHCVEIACFVAIEPSPFLPSYSSYIECWSAAIDCWIIPALLINSWLRVAIAFLGVQVDFENYLFGRPSPIQVAFLASSARRRDIIGHPGFCALNPSRPYVINQAINGHCHPGHLFALPGESLTYVARLFGPCSSRLNSSSIVFPCIPVVP
jgi:hypothetical protein